MVGAGLLAVLAVIALVIGHTSRALRSAAHDVQAEHQIRFALRPLSSVANADFEVISSPAVFFQLPDPISRPGKDGTTILISAIPHIASSCAKRRDRKRQPPKRRSRHVA